MLTKDRDATNSPENIGKAFQDAANTIVQGVSNAFKSTINGI